jgi:predicted DNA-binding transcriptional regulator AlpA
VKRATKIVQVGDRLLSAAEVGLRWNLSRSRIYALASVGELPSIKLNGAVRFDPRDLEEYIREHRRRKGKAA